MNNLKESIKKLLVKKYTFRKPLILYDYDSSSHKIQRNNNTFSFLGDIQFYMIAFKLFGWNSWSWPTIFLPTVVIVACGITTYLRIILFTLIHLNRYLELKISMFEQNKNLEGK